MSSPTARSLEWCRRVGWVAGVVERRQPVGPGKPSWLGKTHDLFGFADLVALDGHLGVLLIQATTGAHHAHREAKLAGAPQGTALEDDEAARRVLVAVRRALAAGNRVEVWSWSKRKVRRGGRAVRWTLRRSRAYWLASATGGNVAWEPVEG